MDGYLVHWCTGIWSIFRHFRVIFGLFRSFSVILGSFSGYFGQFGPCKGPPGPLVIKSGQFRLIRPLLPARAQSRGISPNNGNPGAENVLKLVNFSTFSVILWAPQPAPGALFSQNVIKCAKITDYFPVHGDFVGILDTNFRVILVILATDIWAKWVTFGRNVEKSAENRHFSSKCQKYL